MYRMVWISKYRRLVLVGPIAERLNEIWEEVAAEREWEVIAQEVMPDHVHLFASSPPTVSPADLVKVFKGVSARLLLWSTASTASPPATRRRPTQHPQRLPKDHSSPMLNPTSKAICDHDGSTTPGVFHGPRVPRFTHQINYYWNETIRPAGYKPSERWASRSEDGPRIKEG